MSATVAVVFHPKSKIRPGTGTKAERQFRRALPDRGLDVEALCILRCSF